MMLFVLSLLVFNMNIISASETESEMDDFKEPEDILTDISERHFGDYRFWENLLSHGRRQTPTFTEEQRKFQREALETHNALRAAHCSPPLVLDEAINIRAQLYAEHLAKVDGSLIHSTDRGSQFGENLYAITKNRQITDPNANKVVRTWYTEIQYYNYSNPRYTIETGHFSQIVWKDTKKLGIGYAFARQGKKMFVCAQYNPPGNYGFAYRWNVIEPTCE